MGTKLREHQADAILTGVSQGSKLVNLDIIWNILSRVNTQLLARAVTKVETLNMIDTKLTQEQALEILTSVNEGSTLCNVNISGNNLSGMERGLMAKLGATVSLYETSLSRQRILQVLTKRLLMLT